MSIFVIFRVGQPEKLGAAIRLHFPNDHLELENEVWLVASPGTARELSDKLEITDGKNGTAIVFSMGSYFGRAATNIWDWIKSKAERVDG